MSNVRIAFKTFTNTILKVVWEIVPRQGDMVTIEHVAYEVLRVNWIANDDRPSIEITVRPMR